VTFWAPKGYQNAIFWYLKNIKNTSHFFVSAYSPKNIIKNQALYWCFAKVQKHVFDIFVFSKKRRGKTKQLPFFSPMHTNDALQSSIFSAFWRPRHLKKGSKPVFTIKPDIIWGPSAEPPRSITFLRSPKVVFGRSTYVS